MDNNLLAFLALLLLLPPFLPSPALARHLLRQLDSSYQLLHVAALLSDDSSLHQFHASQWTQIANHDQHGTTLSLRVMHRDSPRSPFRASDSNSTTRQELLWKRLARDAARVESLTSRAQMAAQGFEHGDLEAEKQASVQDFNGPVVSGLAQGSGEYFTRFGIGTPARDNYMVLDTGSDILWIQCAPCVNCYNQTDPIFNPVGSSSYQTIPCTSPLCSKLNIHGCQTKTNHCLYQAAYGDGSFTIGDFSLETLNFKGASMKSVAFGCGHDNQGLFVGAAGLLGLGGGSLSFPSQVGVQIGKKFSYCLVDRAATGSSSDIVFGNSAVPPGTVFTPLLKNPKLDTFYYVHLAGISVGGSRLSIPASAFQLDLTGNGGVIVDSGTSVTRLVMTAYGPLRSAFRAATGHLTSAGGFSLFDTCYDLSAKDMVNVPTLVLHFQDAADMVLPASNYLIPIDNTGTFCFAFASTAGGLSIIGNIQQQGFRVVFDVQTSKVGFAANQCK